MRKQFPASSILVFQVFWRNINEMIFWFFFILFKMKAVALINVINSKIVRAHPLEKIGDSHFKNSLL